MKFVQKYFTLFFFGLALFQIQTASATPLASANADLNQAAYDNGGTFTSETTDANNTTSNDVQLCGDTTNDALYLGMNYIFDMVRVNYGTACPGAHAGTWEYWNGSAWSSLTVLDGTNGFESTASTYNISITIPSDWATTDPDAGGAVTTSAYFIRFRTTTGSADTIGGTQLSSREFNLRVKIQDQLATNITGLTSSAFILINCTDTTKYSFREIGSGIYELALLTQGADTDCNYTAEKDGYVDFTPLSTGSLSSTLIDNSGSPNLLNFGHRVIVTDELGNALTPTSVTAGLNDTACTIVSNIAYCPVLLAEDNVLDATTAFNIVKDGYVTATPNLSSNRAGHGNSQATVTLGNGTGLKFSHRIAVTNELGSALAPTSATAGTSSVACTISSSLAYCPVVMADDEVASNGFIVIKDGYVTAAVNLGGDRDADTTAQQTVVMDTSNGLDFSHKIIVKDELNSALTPTSAIAGASGVACSISTNSVYCPVVLADDNVLDATTAFTVIKDGYVTAVVNLAGGRAAGTTAQQVVTMDTSNGLDFSHKIIVKDELGTDLIPDSATGGTSSVACTISSNSAYCPIVIADDNTLTNGFTVIKDGYVTATANLGADRTNAFGLDAQQVVTMDTSNGLDFSHKVSVMNEVGGALTAATVVVGGTTCSESGIGIYYCATLLANDDAIDDLIVSITGFNNYTANADDRTSATDAQKSHAVFLSGGGGGGSGGGSGVSGSSSASSSIASIPSASEQIVTTRVNFPNDGVVVRPTTIKNEEADITIFIEKGTNITTEQGDPFGDIIWPAAPLLEDKLPTSIPNSFKFLSAFEIKSSEKTFFNKDITIKIPVPKGAEKDSLEVLYWNEATNKYEKAGDGGALSEDGKYMVVKVNHLTLFVLAEISPSSPPPATFTSVFTDIAGNPAAPAIEKLYQLQIVQGRTPTTFDPDGELTRAEMVKVCLAAFAYVIDQAQEVPFHDVSTDSWYINYVATAKNKDIVHGYADGSFKGENIINRVEALKILLTAGHKVLEEAAPTPFADVETSAWYTPYVNYSYHHGILSGKTQTTFAPAATLTRGEMAQMLVNILGL